MKTRVFENPVKFAQSVKIKVDGEYVSLLELLQNADIELDETPTSGSDKAVSSGGVFSALQEKQGQISITKNDDESVDITIPTDGSSAGGGSSGGVTFIDVSTITETNEDGDLVLDLSKNGKYILTNNNNIEGTIRLNFMPYTFITRDKIYFDRVEESLGGGAYVNGESCYIVASLERINASFIVFIKVEDNLATLTCNWET